MVFEKCEWVGLDTGKVPPGGGQPSDSMAATPAPLFPPMPPPPAAAQVVRHMGAGVPPAGVVHAGHRHPPDGGHAVPLRPEARHRKLGPGGCGGRVHAPCRSVRRQWVASGGGGGGGGVWWCGGLLICAYGSFLALIF